MTIMGAVDKLKEMQKETKVGGDSFLTIQTILEVFGMLSEPVFEEYFLDYLEEYYEGDITNAEEAKEYLSDFYDEDMTDEEAIEEACNLQVEYYRQEADFYEILQKVIEVYQG